MVSEMVSSEIRQGVSVVMLAATIGFLFILLWAMFSSLFRTLFSEHANTTNDIMLLLLVNCAISLFR